ISLSARAMPWQIAPAWPVMPPPCTETIRSILLFMSHRLSGPRTALRSFSSVKYCSSSRPLMRIWPEPSVKRTRATADLRRPVPMYAFVAVATLLLPYRITRVQSDLEFLGLLGLVLVRRPGVDLQLAHLLAAELV